MSLQTTIAQSVSCQGVGVHSGKACRMVLRPAPEGQGLMFVRTDLPDGAQTIPVHIDNVTEVLLGTTLTGPDGASVATVEHFLAACRGMGVDNLTVALDGPELAIMDGSARPFCQLIEAAGLLQQGQARTVVQILSPITVRHGVKWARLLPHDDPLLALDVEIDFEPSFIGRQHLSISLDPDVFQKDIAFARTFAFEKDLEHLRKQGRALGGTLDNAILVTDDGVLNPTGLRGHDEFVRHKTLDIIGDLSLLGREIWGRYEGYQPGHALNIQLLKALTAAPGAWRAIPATFVMNGMN